MEEVKSFSQAVVKYIAKLIPDRFSAVLGPKNRIGKIFIDYLRNAKGATTSMSMRPGLVKDYLYLSRFTERRSSNSSPQRGGTSPTSRSVWMSSAMMILGGTG